MFNGRMQPLPRNMEWLFYRNVPNGPFDPRQVLNDQFFSWPYSPQLPRGPDRVMGLCGDNNVYRGRPNRPPYHRNYYPYRRSSGPVPQRRSHLDDVYFPNYDDEDSGVGNEYNQQKRSGRHPNWFRNKFSYKPPQTLKQLAGSSTSCTGPPNNPSKETCINNSSNNCDKAKCENVKSDSKVQSELKTKDSSKNTFPASVSSKLFDDKCKLIEESQVHEMGESNPSNKNDAEGKTVSNSNILYANPFPAEIDSDDETICLDEYITVDQIDTLESYLNNPVFLDDREVVDMDISPGKRKNEDDEEGEETAKKIDRNSLYFDINSDKLLNKINEVLKENKETRTLNRVRSRSLSPDHATIGAKSLIRSVSLDTVNGMKSQVSYDFDFKTNLLLLLKDQSLSDGNIDVPNSFNDIFKGINKVGEEEVATNAIGTNQEAEVEVSKQPAKEKMCVNVENAEESREIVAKLKKNQMSAENIVPKPKDIDEKCTELFPKLEIAVKEEIHKDEVPNINPKRKSLDDDEGQAKRVCLNSETKTKDLKATDKEETGTNDIGCIKSELLLEEFMYCDKNQNKIEAKQIADHSGGKKESLLEIEEELKRLLSTDGSREENSNIKIYNTHDSKVKVNDKELSVKGSAKTTSVNTLGTEANIEGLSKDENVHGKEEICEKSGKEAELCSDKSVLPKTVALIMKEEQNARETCSKGTPQFLSLKNASPEKIDNSAKKIISVGSDEKSKQNDSVHSAKGEGSSKSDEKTNETKNNKSDKTRKNPKKIIKKKPNPNFTIKLKQKVKNRTPNSVQSKPKTELGKKENFTSKINANHAELAAAAKEPTKRKAVSAWDNANYYEKFQRIRLLFGSDSESEMEEQKCLKNKTIKTQHKTTTTTCQVPESPMKSHKLTNPDKHSDRSLKTKTFPSIKKLSKSVEKRRSSVPADSHSVSQKAVQVPGQTSNKSSHSTGVAKRIEKKRRETLPASLICENSRRDQGQEKKTNTGNVCVIDHKLRDPRKQHHRYKSGGEEKAQGLATEGKTLQSKTPKTDQTATKSTPAKTQPKLKYGVQQSEEIKLSQCLVLLTYRFPMLQRAGSTIQDNDCCDMAITLEGAEITDKVETMKEPAKKMNLLQDDDVIELKPNIPIIDLTEESLKPKTELLKVEKPTNFKTEKEMITLYRSEETVNNSLDVQATSETILPTTLITKNKENTKNSTYKELDTAKLPVPVADPQNWQKEPTNNHNSTQNVTNPTPYIAPSSQIVSQVPHTTQTTLNTAMNAGLACNNFLTPPTLLRQNSRNYIPVVTIHNKSPVISRNSNIFVRENYHQAQSSPSFSVQKRAQPVVNSPLRFRTPLTMLAQMLSTPSQSDKRQNPPPSCSSTITLENLLASNSVTGNTPISHSLRRHTDEEASTPTNEISIDNIRSAGIILAKYVYYFQGVKKAEWTFINHVTNMTKFMPLVANGTIVRFRSFILEEYKRLCKELVEELKRINPTGRSNRLVNVQLVMDLVFETVQKLLPNITVSWFYLMLEALMRSEIAEYLNVPFLRDFYSYVTYVTGRMRNACPAAAPQTGPSRDPFTPEQRRLLERQIRQYLSLCADQRRGVSKSRGGIVQVQQTSTNTNTLAARHNRSPPTYTPRTDGGSQSYVPPPVQTVLHNSSNRDRSSLISNNTFELLNHSESQNSSNNKSSPAFNGIFEPPSDHLEVQNCLNDNRSPHVEQLVLHNAVRDAAPSKPLQSQKCEINPQQNGSNAEKEQVVPNSAPPMNNCDEPVEDGTKVKCVQKLESACLSSSILPKQEESSDSKDWEIETIDLTWINDINPEQLQSEIEWVEIKKEEPVEEENEEVVLNEERFAVAPSPADSGISSPPIQVEYDEMVFSNRSCICGKLAEYICGCMTAMYCSVECQLADWGTHKDICVKHKGKSGKEGSQVQPEGNDKK